MSEQDEPSPALCLAPRAGKMELYCPLRISRLGKIKDFFFGVLSHILNPLLTKLVPVKMAGYWPRFFFACLWTETKSRLVNNPNV